MIMSIQAMTHAKDDQLGSLCIHIIGGYQDEKGYSKSILTWSSIGLQVFRIDIGSPYSMPSQIREDNATFNVCSIEKYRVFRR